MQVIITAVVTGRHVSPPLWNTLRIEEYLLVSATRYFLWIWVMTPDPFAGSYRFAF
ncbi:hypothetical protein PanWU01x14_313200 [Parasponia andersonii]|uniref:Uncharacterized protein n=1 Tax=Parasponia andersonii TaxID=3476 RepID=A0A2P5AP85_PARAD|nr:hypothetical protein PanWU01x14_313200 [Parasponia andersonii]